MKYLNRVDFATFVGSRHFLLANDTHYQTFNLLNKEFSFDVDVSRLPCGVNGALNFVGMDADGGVARYPTNTAGAKYGTGYCDAQCPRYLKFIDGRANVEGWTPYDRYSAYFGDEAYADSGFGNQGSCCSQIDIWNANQFSTQLSVKPCLNTVQTQCNGDACGGRDSISKYGKSCDPDGCDFNPYRVGDTSFYGPGKVVDTTKKFTVTTQFVTSDGTAEGTLVEVKRFYVQNGVKIPNPQANTVGLSGNSLTSTFCNAEKDVFGDANSFEQFGGFKEMTKAIRNGMVLTMSVWDDRHEDMLWLDSTWPTNGTGPGVVRGTCGYDEASIDAIIGTAPTASVVFSKIRFGDIGSTA